MRRPETIRQIASVHPAVIKIKAIITKIKPIAGGGPFLPKAPASIAIPIIRCIIGKHAKKPAIPPTT
jgi:hypothetical protein